MQNATVEDYVTRYNQLYWEANELRIIATPFAIKAAEAKENEMRSIERILGFMPTP